MALEIREELGGNLITVTVTGKLVKADYTQFVPQIEARMQRVGKVRILFIMKDFHGWDIGAAWEDIKFDARHFSDIDKLAVVGETKWEQWMVSFCKPFTRATVKYFDASQLDAAREWLGEGNMAEERSTSMEVSLTETERQLLISLLESELQQVRSENYHAESHAVKELLKEREARIHQLLALLKDR